MILHIIFDVLIAASCTLFRLFLVDNSLDSSRLLLKLLSMGLRVTFFTIFLLMSFLLSVMVLFHLLLIFHPFSDDVASLLLSSRVFSFNYFVVSSSNFIPVLFNLLIQVVRKFNVNFFVFADSLDQSFENIHPVNLLFWVIMYFNLQIFQQIKSIYFLNYNLLLHIKQVFVLLLHLLASFLIVSILFIFVKPTASLT